MKAVTILSLFLTIFPLRAMAFVDNNLRRGFDDLERSTSSYKGLEPIGIILGLIVICLFCSYVISRISPLYEHSGKTALLITCGLLFFLQNDSLVFVIKGIGVIGLLLFLLKTFPIFIFPLIGFSLFSSLAFLDELFTGRRIEYLLGFAVLPVISYFFLKSFRKSDYKG